MKKYFLTLLLSTFVFGYFNLTSQAIDKDAIYDSLTTLDPEIMQYFPRWKVCESDLQIQIYQAFQLIGYPKENLDMQNIQVLAAPREFDDSPYQILMLTCGTEKMNSVAIESNLGPLLVGFLSGELYYSGPNRSFPKDFAKRDYCFEDIPINIPMTKDQTAEIINYLQPTNVNHAISISLFEQSLKIGQTGFWLNSKLGTDEVGYHFWSAGEAKIVLRRPLYVNSDIRTSRGIPYLINAYLGGGYRHTTGIHNDNTVLSWVKSRSLNADKGGKLIGGIDFHMPFHPEFGVHLNAEIPMSSLKAIDVDQGAWGYYLKEGVQLPYPLDTNNVDMVAPVIRSTGQFTLFYNYWLSKEYPENFFRFDFGINYYEVRELAAYRDSARIVTVLTPDAIGLATYKPSEVGDWIYFRAEYRNQAAYPFGFSLQYANQILLGRVYVPLMGQWLYIEGKYATPLRAVRPYETRHFFMLSPVIRLTI